MKVALHDNVHFMAGKPHPQTRATLTDTARAPLVRAMYDRLRRVPRDGGAFVVDVDVDVGTLRAGAVRHADALSVTLSTMPADKLVAAGALLRGASTADDDAAVRAVREAVTPYRFGPQDFAAMVAEPRPCIATLYLDARWYDNARVEWVTTALALAALHGPEGRLNVEGEAVTPSPRPQPAAWSEIRQDGLKFNFTRERLQRVMGMVAKKGSAAIEGRTGAHFRVYPPRQFLERPGVLRGRDIYDKLADTAWWVRWYDDDLEQLRFGELLGFVDQIAEAERAFSRSVGVEFPPTRQPHNESVWSRPEPNRPSERRAVRVQQTVDTRLLVQDKTIKRIFSSLTLEPAPLPPETTSPSPGSSEEPSPPELQELS
jgi:hypothetical protein